MHSTEDTARGVKHSNAASTGAPESGNNITVTKDTETWGWLANGLNVLLSMSILEIGHLAREDAEDVQCVASFCQKLNQQLLERYQ